MQLDDWIKEQNMTYPKFAEIVGTTVLALFRIRNGEITKSVKLIREIERYTMGKVLLKDICDAALKKKEKKRVKRIEKQQE